jgi:LacI family transcriptional regulator
MLTTLRNEEFPTVLIQQDAVSSKISSIIVDDNKGGYEAISYLVSLGHRRIGVIGRNKEGSILYRINGYKRALRDNKLNYEEELIQDAENGIETGYNATKKFLERIKELPTALFTTTDLTAIGAIRAIKEKGLKIPDDISIIGFDDVTISSYIDPPLTTMRINKRELGTQAVSELIKLLEEKKGGERIILQAELVVRGTCRNFP